MSENKPECSPNGGLPSTPNDVPEPTRVLMVPEVVPAIPHGPAADGAAGAEGEQPLEGSDAEAYAALKAKRAERRRKKLVRRGIAVGAVAAVLLVASIVVSAMGNEPEADMEPVLDIAMRGDFTIEVDGSGTLQPLSSTIVTPEVPGGQIESVKVSAGQSVKKGDVLMTIKNDELDRAVTEAERSLKQSRENLAAAKEALSQAQAQPSQPQHDVTGDDMIPGSDTSELQAAVRAAEAEVESAQSAYDDAVALASNRSVKAPLTGSIVAMNAQVGQNLGDSTGTEGPLMQIADLTKMKVTIQVGEEQIASVKKDQHASITFPAFEGLALEGRVTSIASIATGANEGYYEGSSPTFAVDILIDEPDARLKPGMTASVVLTTTRLDDVIMVPLTALQTDDGENYYVNVQTDPENGAMEPRDVTVVAKNADYAVVGRPADAEVNSKQDMVTSPLEDGEVLVIAGGIIDEGMPEDEMEMR